MSVISREEWRKRIHHIAEERGYGVIEESVEMVITGLIKRYKKYRKYYCPCQVVGDGVGKECPCGTLDEQIERNGKCHCNLYKSKP